MRIPSFRNFRKTWLLLFFGALALHSCSDGTESPEVEGPDPIEPEMSTFDIIQSKIFEPNCVSCHKAGTSFATQSDLILTADIAYDQLVNKSPKNLGAIADGLELVGTKGLESIAKSFLWEKINTPDFEHFLSDHPEYGEFMPLGGQSLTNGELRFIHDWIVEGAPKTGMVVDESILEDTDRFVIPVEDFIALTPPAQGLQLKLGPFDVWPNAERELFQYQDLGNTEDIYIKRVEVSMRTGSHHFIMNDFPGDSKPPANQIRDYWSEDGSFNAQTAFFNLFSRFVFGTQLRQTDYTFPDGVALRLPANAALDLNSHYVNRTDEMKTGEVSVNIHTVDKSEVEKVAQNLFENYTDFELPPNKVTTLVKRSSFDEKMEIFQLTSHAHEHMTEFRIYMEGGTRDGEMVYFTNDWEHPPIIEFDPPITLMPGDGFRAEATYDNNTDQTLSFGLLSENEMMIVFGAFYRD